MTLTGTMVLLVGGGLAAIGCSSDGAPATCENGQTCGSDGGPPADGGSPADGGPPGTCGNVQPCGGEVVGNWTFTETCQSSARFAASAMKFSTMAESSWCPGQTLVGIEPEAAGSLVLDGCRDLHARPRVRRVHRHQLPGVVHRWRELRRCDRGLSGADRRRDVPQSQRHVHRLLRFLELSCATRRSTAPQYASGTYALSGNVLSFTATTGVVTNKGYCVAGNTLHILDTSTGSTGQTAIDSDLVAMKQ